jgi:mono/diheme cytochrome c family protein
MADGMAHYADHCAVCHANDGSGDTEMGRGLYPKPPDMRRDPTQRLSDGELFYIIENGVRFTGMPGWGTGTAEDEQASWRLVRFIRHLPRLTAAEEERMKRLNPKSPDEWREEEEIQRFLGGEGGGPATPHSAHEHGDHQ